MSTYHRITLLVLSVILALAAGAAPRSGAGQPSQPAAQPTPLLVSATNAPLRVRGSDGMDHLEYDLIITNVFAAPVTLMAIEVIAPDGRGLLRLANDTLAANLEPVFFPAPNASPSARIPVGAAVAAVIDVVVPPGSALARINHRMSFELPADIPAVSLIAGRTLIGPELAVDPRAPLVIAPPLRGNGWFSGDACCQAYSVHRSPRLVLDGARFSKPETFAIDWERFQDGRLWTGDGTRNEQYFAFGADVVSAADGTVVAVRDDMPDETPKQPPVTVKEADDYIGNHVIVQIRPDVWAVYGHLQQGSVAVRVGERVSTGRLLGRVGNSGNSTGPHLHFQLSDGPDVFTSTSLPFVFDRYTLAGTADLEGLRAAYADPSAPVDVRIDGIAEVQTETYPLVLTVQDFR